MKIRRGGILIVVSGMSALLAALSLAFIARMRTDAEEQRLLATEAQARLMLAAACGYVLETSRLGWGVETCGWIDVRDGTPGPKSLGAKSPGDPRNDYAVAGVVDRDGNRVYLRGSGVWPDIGGIARCPFHVLTRPPFALRGDAYYNPIVTDEADVAAFGRPYLRNPDPVPAVDDQAAFNAGDLRPRATSVGLSWFRVLRLSPARFLLTCGAGATRGFRDWAEVVAAGETGAFADRTMFEQLAQGEVRLWYLIEWNAACGDSYNGIDNLQNGVDHYVSHAMSASNDANFLTQPMHRNLVGTVRWIQRVTEAPARW
ncbi:MAG TPA: hypothetical protein VEL07_05590 [Planctomycetota bacterium]|nr:hypothetical protein [Planctomycetota bacterium]